MLEARDGERVTPEQAEARTDGSLRHEEFHVQGQRADGISGTKRWCFIATAVYGGSAPETVTLRKFRDRVLRQRRFGRFAVRLYYAQSPRIAILLEHAPAATSVAKAVLDIVVRCIRMKQDFK